MNGTARAMATVATVAMAEYIELTSAMNSTERKIPIRKPSSAPRRKTVRGLLEDWLIIDLKYHCLHCKVTLNSPLSQEGRVGIWDVFRGRYYCKVLRPAKRVAVWLREGADELRGDLRGSGQDYSLSKSVVTSCFRRGRCLIIIAQIISLSMLS